MEKISLKEIDNHIVFIDNQEKYDEIYSIPIDDLAEVRMEDNIATSEWISQLNETIWSYPDLLYRLAKIIQTKFPNNHINWQETFYEVEKKDYLEKYFDMTNEFDNKLLSMSEEFMKLVNQGQQENTLEVNEEIDKLILENLSRYKIL